MSILKQAPWHVQVPHPVSEAARLLGAALLASASAVLARLAARLVAEPAWHDDEPRFEFHAEAGAPEGALYVDGCLVGWLPGVSRL